MSSYLGAGVLIAGLAALGYWSAQSQAPRIEGDIRGRVGAVSVPNEHPLDLRVSGRDIRVTGYVDDLEARSRVLSALNAIEGHRVVEDGLVVLPRTEPFEFRVTKAGEELQFEGYAPSAKARRRLSEAAGAESLSLPLASGAPEAWTDAVTRGIEAIGHLKGGELEFIDAAAELRGTAETYAERERALSVMEGLPAEFARDVDIDVLDDGTLTFSMAYDAETGFDLSGRVPKGVDSERVSALTGIEEVTADITPSLVANADLERILGRLSGWLPDMEKLSVRNDEDGLSVEAILSPGTDEPLVAEALGDLEGATLSVETSTADVEVGARRVNVATDREEVRVDGFWLPDLRFDANVAACRSRTRDVLDETRINFVTGSARLGPRSNRAINHLAAIVRLCTQKAGLTVLLGRRTDDTGDPGRNRTLSRERAEAIREALVLRGVPQAAIRVKGYGADRSVAGIATDEGRATNRRTTIEWIQ